MLPKWNHHQKRKRTAKCIAIHRPCCKPILHDNVINWKHFSRYWPFAWGNSPVTGEFPSRSPMTRRIDVFFDLHPKKRLSKQSRRWWIETPSCSLWRHCNGGVNEPLQLASAHWSRDEIAAISQTFSNAFSWIKRYEFAHDFTEVCFEISN